MKRKEMQNLAEQKLQSSNEREISEPARPKKIKSLAGIFLFFKKSS